MNTKFTEKNLLEDNLLIQVFEYYAQTEELDLSDIKKICITFLEKIKDQINPKIFQYVDYAKEFYFGKHIGDEEFLEEKRIELWHLIGNFSESNFYKEGRLVLYTLYSKNVAIKMNTNDPVLAIIYFFSDAIDLNPDNWTFIEPCVADYYTEISKN